MMPQPATEYSSYAIDRLMTATAVASILGVSTKTVHKLVREGRLGCVQVTSKERRFRIDQVKDFIKSQSVDVRVDTKPSRPLSSTPKKGGKKKSVGLSRTDLRKEIRSWR